MYEEKTVKKKGDITDYLFNTALKEEIVQFDRLYKQKLEGHNPLYQYMIDYIGTGNGKRIRPLLVFLSAKMCGKIVPKTSDLAVIVELLHIMTLVHDDIVDSTLERRNRPSVNAKYGNQMAVLLGDYVLTLAIQMGVKTKDFEVLEIFAQLAQNLVDGELTQLVSSKESIISEERYFDIIKKKTAILLASCTQMGALSTNADSEKVSKLYLIGEKLGLCFQIKDDIFDYFEQGDIGKPTGNDIREGKITLPLIHALDSAPKEISDKMKKIVTDRDLTSENISKLIAFAKEYNGIEYAYDYMEKIKSDVIELLADFPESEAKSAMIYLIDYIIERNK